MEAENAPTFNASSLPTSPPRGQRAPREDLRSPRRGGGGQRGRGGPPRDNAGRGRGRGRGSQEKRRATAGPSSASGVPPASQPARVPPAQTLIHSMNGTDAQQSVEDAVEAEVCFICASPVVHNSIAPCNHRTCHICALRMRALYKTNACAHCRSESQYVIFTDDANKRYEDFSQEDFAQTDVALGIKYEKIDIYEDTVLLLRFNCPENDCEVACYGWPDLQRHVKGVHYRVMCDLCTRNKKVFTHEHELFTHASLEKHQKFGDDNPGAIDQSGFKGHPRCDFCRQRFYGDDELYTHCRDKHERCHICDRRSTDGKYQYFRDYNDLETHFKSDHFLCSDQECLEKKFVVFESEMDLKAHQLEAHPHGMSRDARRVDMRGFDYRQPHQESEMQRQPGGRGRGRGRDPNVESIPVSSAQPMRRDELAYQRSLAIHSAQSVSNRTFGGQLSTGPGDHSSGPRKNPATVPPLSNSTPTTPDLSSLSLSNVTPSQPQTAAERARTLRHAHLLERASNLLSSSQTSLNTFRTLISSYRTSTITAPNLIDRFLSLFTGTAPSALGTLIKELADLFEITTKRDDLLKAWNDWRAINDAEDYPSLPAGVAGAESGILPGMGGKRILKLKSSTAQSGRSAVSRSGSWGTSSLPPSTLSSTVTRPNAFPSLPTASSSKAWASASSTPPLQSQSQQSQNTTRRPPPLQSSAELFPALPAAQKPGMNSMRPGAIGTPRIRGSGTGTPVNVWASSAANGGVGLGAAVEAALAVQEQEESGGKGKGKGRKKVLLDWA